MLLRNSISNTKKFFRKTIQSFKSLFSGDYQRLPKSPPHIPNDFDKFYTEFTNKWDSHKDKAKKGSKKLQEKEVYSGSFVEFSSQAYPMKKKNHVERRSEEYHNHEEMKSVVVPHKFERKRREEYSSKKRKTNWLVVQKLKELEMLDMSNVDHLLDIEEVLHYYSRLTCPAYLEIVDKFFMEMCAEFFGAAETLTPARSIITSRLKPRSVRL